jgi:hypothetical protein
MVTRFGNFINDALNPGNIVSFGVASYKNGFFRDLTDYEPRARLGTIRRRAERAV